jgi:hypothetical protein
MTSIPSAPDKSTLDSPQLFALWGILRLCDDGHAEDGSCNKQS